MRFLHTQLCVNRYKYVLSFIFVLMLGNAFSANLWQKAVGRNLLIQGERKIIPQQSFVTKLDDATFRFMQPAIPTEASGQSIILSLPLPDGSIKEFRVFERSMMEQELADKYPSIKTYEAICVEDPSVTAKLDYTEFGFHAMVFSKNGTYFIDPYSNLNTGFYNCYYKKDYVKASGKYPVCAITGKPALTPTTNTINRAGTTTANNSVTIVHDGKIRTFRLALACTIEYSAAVGGAIPTKASVLSAMVTSMNRVNGIYEKELSIHMNLVAKEDTLIFLTTDTYSNDDGGAMLSQNQTVCDKRIGNANYDIGHVFSTGGGGVAGLGVVCSAGDKANGVTGSGDPVGDGFDVDYVAHEMGHQFGANHTFNATSGSCSGNREASAAYEPGSATTIMGYAGICGNTNDIQLHSDDYFHRISINEIFSYISTTSCAVITTNSVAIPVVTNYADSFFVPYKTSFEITAKATGSSGHPLTYCWEEWDLGPAGNWNAANNTKAPIFRSFNPSTSATRVFPRWDSLINNSIKYKGEVLPETTRDVKFKCMVRDINNSGYGVYNAPDKNLIIKSVTTTGLFRVTSQATAATITGNTTKTITWDVAGTTASPISCINVDIYLSLDSARTFPYLLAGNVTNNGTHDVIIPDVVTANASARIKVKGHGNVFFDLNDGWIKINQGVVAVAAAFTPGDTTVCEGSLVVLTNKSTGTPDSVRWTISGGTPATSTSLTTVDVTFIGTGPHTVSMIAYKSGTASAIFSKTVTVNPVPTILFTPSAPVICAGDSVSISANYNPGATCIWSTGSSNTTITVAPLVNTYYSVSVTNNGCTGTDSVQVIVNPKKTTNISRTICDNDSVVIGSQVFKTSGTFTVHLQTSLACDSAVVLDLTVNPTKTINISSTICDGDSVTIGAQVFKTPGAFTVHFQTSLSCDSSVVLDLTVNPVKVTDIAKTICDGDFVLVGTQTFTTAGLHTVHLQTSATCDSTVNLDITIDSVSKPVIDVRNDSLVAGGSTGTSYKWYLNGNLITTTAIPAYKPSAQGNWTVVVVNANNCESSASDAILLTSVKVNKSDVLFAIVPNPNKGQFEVQITAIKNAKYSLVLYNVAGQDVLKDELNVHTGANTKSYSLENIEKGMYFISLIGNDGITTQNIMVQ